MQKLVTIYLDNADYLQKRGWLKGIRFEKQHGYVEEHLADYLSDGWRIASISALGGSRRMSARGWVVVVLEKDELAAESPSSGS